MTQLGAFENELGVQPPVGFWDPLNFTESGDVEDFRRRREAELKNGRVAMFATMGYITPEYFKFSGFLAPSSNLKFEDVPNGLKALNVVPVEGWLQIIGLAGFYETCVNVPVDPSEPGNYGRGRLGITGSSIKDPEQRKRALNAELANGRLAMMASLACSFKMDSQGLPGEIGHCMKVRHFELLKASSVCKLQWAFGIHLALQPVVTWQHTVAGAKVNSNMVALVCWQPWDTSLQKFAVDGPAFSLQQMA